MFLVHSQGGRRFPGGNVLRLEKPVHTPRQLAHLFVEAIGC